MGISALLAAQILDASATGRSVLTGADASAIRTTLGLGTLATQSPTGTPSASTFLRGDYSWQTIDLSGYVPYSGATGAVNLGANGLTASQATLSAGTLNGTVLDIAQTWGGTGTYTGIKYNVTDSGPANAASLLMDLQVGGTSRFHVRKDGILRILGSQTEFGSAGVGRAYINTSAGLNLASGQPLAWSPNTDAAAAASDTILVRDAAQTLAQRNSTSPQVHRIYNTFTDASNYERAKIAWESTVLRIGTEKAGTGSARALELQTDGTTRLTIGATGNVGIGTGDTTDLLTVRAATAGTPQGLTISGQTSVRHATLTLTHDQKTAKVGLSRLSGDIITANNGYELVVSNTDSICIATNNASGVIRFLTGSLVEALRITSGGIVALGGATSSFPAIKRNGAAINFRLADDSADAGITASTATFSGNLTVSAVNIVTDTTTGTKIGTATNQKLGFFNATPVVQPTAVANATDAASVITQLNALLSRMRDLGLIAT